ncbi:hypothetical protein C8Q76DRAFT_688606 [Earliella scabrosa]|nr:hypothetical protein C8Q76DRAFT_688606 [Earliella scabrosa]
MSMRYRRRVRWCLPASSADDAAWGRRGALGHGHAEVLRSCPSPAREEPRRRSRLSSNLNGTTGDGLEVVESDGGKQAGGGGGRTLVVLVAPCRVIRDDHHASVVQDNARAAGRDTARSSNLHHVRWQGAPRHELRQTSGEDAREMMLLVNTHYCTVQRRADNAALLCRCNQLNERREQVVQLVDSRLITHDVLITKSTLIYVAHHASDDNLGSAVATALCGSRSRWTRPQASNTRRMQNKRIANSSARGYGVLSPPKPSQIAHYIVHLNLDCLEQYCAIDSTTDKSGVSGCPTPEINFPRPFRRYLKVRLYNERVTLLLFRRTGVLSDWTIDGAWNDEPHCLAAMTAPARVG